VRLARLRRISKGVHAIVLLSLLFAATGDATAERLPIKTYTTSDGLVRDHVSRIVQDSQGFLWFCTSDGLSRFDGYNFTSYRAEEGLPFPLVNDMLESGRGLYWLATNGGGVLLFDLNRDSQAAAGSNGKPTFTAYPVGDTTAASRVNALYQDRAGNLWAGTDGGLFRLDAGDAERKFRRVEIGLISHPDEVVQVWAMLEDREGSVWVATKFGLLRRTPNGRMIHYAVGASSNTDHVHALLEDGEGRLWLGHESGLIVVKPCPLLVADCGLVDRRSKAVTPISLNPKSAIHRSEIRGAKLQTLPGAEGEARRYGAADGLLSGRVSALYQSADGHVWIGIRSSGVSEFDGGRFRNHTMAQGLSDSDILTIAEDREGGLWMGTYRRGAMRLARNGFVTYSESDGLIGGVGSVFEDHSGELCVVSENVLISRFDGSRFVAVRPNLPKAIVSWRPSQNSLEDHTGDWWFGTSAGVYRFPKVNRIEQLSEVKPKAVYTSQNGLPDNDAAYLFEDRRGDIWIGTFSPGREILTRWERTTDTFHHYSDANGLRPFSAATAFCEDAAGNLWISFRGGGIARYEAGRFKLFTEADGLPPGHVRYLYLDHAGRLWGPVYRGLFRIEDPAADQPRITTYSAREGLMGGSIYRVVEDAQGHVYIATSRGIDRLDDTTGQFKHFSNAAGISNTDFNSAFRDRNQLLWFGTNAGLLRFAPEPDRPAQPPQIRIGALSFAGVRQPLSALGETAVAGLELGPNENQLQIDFFGLSFSPSGPLSYQYRVEGLDADWSEATDHRTVNYASLAPGAYRFLVRAVAADGTLSQSPATVSFRILPPVWRRWWFIAIAATVIALVIGAFARNRYQRLRALRESESRFRTLAETASDAIITIDEESRIVLVNQAAERTFGYTQQELIGAELTALMPEYLRHLHRAGFKRYNETGKKHISWEGVELPGLHKSGREIPLELSFGEFTRGGKRFITGIARDITERKRAEQERRQAEEALSRSREERLAELERVRRRIATDLHDDIGSSLTRISLLSEVVQRQVDGVEAPVVEPLSLIARLSRELVDSMSDIVWAINPKKDHLSDLSQRMRHFASDLFTARGIDFRFNAPDTEKDIKVGANFRRELFLLFKEAVNNVVRHSGCSQADIEFRAEADGLFLRLSDDGRGFDLSQKSSGHGLASMRERTEGLGGKLEIVSREHEGTTLTFTIPLTNQEQASSVLAAGKK
jgi:PAS domain S-box-containing protein